MKHNINFYKFICTGKFKWFCPRNLFISWESYGLYYLKLEKNILQNISRLTLKRTYFSNEIAACHCSSQYRLRSYQDSQICVVARSFLKCTSCHAVWAKSMAYSLQFNRSDVGLKLQMSAFKLFTVANLRHQLRLWYVITLLYSPTDAAP